ncbi:hypothetical protein DWF00_14570 [Bosea caraganae]|uniref:Uncharacterized protein n=1 Tax=Bosea caraganae TaxID=2763117 RepID=A0A370KYK3_9HYPH|nr:hypothetical protein [Bosea caraganae]RDJ20026.1 hypothetical protein DWE98_26455 [Bosea caraganae]RDJ25633.1 hypothetical protein DWF00_14570 [Bosea caraganae]
MDITVTQKADEAAWLLTDLLGRPMGDITEEPAGEFRIVSAGQAVETMKDMKHGPFPSLDAALAEIERFTRSACRRVSPKPASAEKAG